MKVVEQLTLGNQEIFVFDIKAISIVLTTLQKTESIRIETKPHSRLTTSER